MPYPLTPGGPLPPPPPVLWAPRLRRWLMHALAHQDRLKAGRLAAKNQVVVDAGWKAAYEQWWDHWGWWEGAPPPDQAAADLAANRTRKPAA